MTKRKRVRGEKWQSAQEDNRSAQEDNAAPPRSLDWTLPITLCFLVGLALYLVWFYRVEYVAGVPRARALSLLLVPDQLIWQWFGDQAGQVCVTDRLPIVGVALAIWVVAYLLGQLSLESFRVTRVLDRLERFVFALGVGAAELSLLTLAAGLAGLLHHRVVFVLFGVGVVVASLLRRYVVRRRDAWHDNNMTRTWSLCRSALGRPAWWWCLVPFTLVILLGAMLPPVDFDVLEYHLQVPKQWFLDGRVSFLPCNIYGNMPLGAETLALLAMVLMPEPMPWWWGALAGKLLIAGFAPLTALALFLAGRRFLTVRAGVVAALLYLSTAWVAMVSLHGLIDGVLAFYGLLCVYALKLWFSESRATGRWQWGLVALTGFLAGTTVACKYTGLLFFVMPLSLLVLIGARGSRGRSVLVFTLAVAVACGPWLVKNWVLSGNPTYPLLYSVFDGETRTPEKDAQWRAAHQVPKDVHGRRYSPAQAWQAMLQLAGRSRWQHPLIFPFVLLTVFCWRDWRRWGAWLGIAGYLLITWWLFTHRLDRFWIPALPILTLIAGVGATWSSSVLWRRTVWAVLAVGLMINFLLISSALVGDNRYFVDLVQLRDDPHLTRLSAAHRYLNRQVKPGNRVLLVGDAAVFDLQVDNLYNTCFDDCIFEQLMRDRTAEQRRRELRRLGISHVYVDWAEIRRYRTTYGFTDYVTPALVHGQLERMQGLLRKVHVPNLEPAQGEIFEVRADSKEGH